MAFFFDSVEAKGIAGVCAFTALIMAIVQIIQHLRHYSEPVFQRYIVRLIFMVPMYSLCSFPSLLAEDAAIYITTVRDCYEAWIIYNFMSLCLAYVGGAGAVEVKMNGFILMPSWAATTCCLPPLPVNGQFIRSVKRGALQFVLVKPILAALTLVLYSTGHYEEGDWSPSSSYLWITIVYNITYTVALYALLLFYMGTHELLVPFRPLLKFVLVKSVIFLTFWQGLFIAICVGSGLVASSSDGNNIQNFLICVEMLPAAICMMFAFPWREYASAGTGLSGDSVGHALSLQDLVSDTVHQFAPTYQNYVLYSDGINKGGRLSEGSDPGTSKTPTHNGAGGAASAAGGVELGGSSGWQAGKGAGSQRAASATPSPATEVGRSKYLVADDNDNPFDDSKKSKAPRGANAAAEARWQSINLGPAPQ